MAQLAIKGHATTREEIQKYADELAQQYFPNGHNIWARENIEAQFVSEACVRMAEHIEQELIKKACEWIKNNTWALYNRNEYEVEINNLLNDFCKAMEE